MSPTSGHPAMRNVATGLFLSAALLTVHAAQAADPAPALDGAELFATHCAICHNSAYLARRVQRAADPDPARAQMAAFLSRHGRFDATADRAIIQYLATSSFR
jgi:mono/diheme cytochrome c family protein